MNRVCLGRKKPGNLCANGASSLHQRAHQGGLARRAPQEDLRGEIRGGSGEPRHFSCSALPRI